MHDTPECADQAASAMKHIEKVTEKLQYLRCNSCGNSVASVEKACCGQSVNNCIGTMFRMAGHVIKSVFSGAWVAATQDDAAQWLAIHDSASRDKNGRLILPTLFHRTAAAQKVEADTLQMLNLMDEPSARLITQGCFRSRPFTLMASSFRAQHADKFAAALNTSLTSTCSEKEPSFSSSFGKVIDKQLKWAVKHGVEEKVLSDEWSASTSSFGELPYATMPFPHCIFVTLWPGTPIFAACNYVKSATRSTATTLSSSRRSNQSQSQPRRCGRTPFRYVNTFVKWPSRRRFYAQHTLAASL
jgi:ribosomal protein L37E